MSAATGDDHAASESAGGPRTCGLIAALMHSFRGRLVVHALCPTARTQPRVFPCASVTPHRVFNDLKQHIQLFYARLNLIRGIGLGIRCIRFSATEEETLKLSLSLGDARPTTTAQNAAPINPLRC